MERYRIELARAVDALATAARAVVTESRTELALYQLAGLDARAVVDCLEPAGFTLTRLADEGGDVRPDRLDGSFEGLELVAHKPIVPDGIFPVLTASGFRSILERPPSEAVLWVQGLESSIETVTTCYLPWGLDHAFAAGTPPADPSRVVRYLGAGHPPEPIGRWLLRDPETDVSSRFLAPWREVASEALARALSQELETDGRLLFRGPPPTRFRNDGASRVDLGSLAALQKAVAWVYENPRELENRHGLLAAEVARTALRDGSLADLASITGVALEGARIAYGFGVSQQSRDALKSLSDLRKGVADETTKLADATRTLAAAVMTSAIGNVSLVVARLTIAKGSHYVGAAAVVIGVALAIYVGVVIGSGWHFLLIQRGLRDDWRARLYRFLGDDEYERMVVIPVEKAEAGYRNAAIGAGVIAALMCLAILLVVLNS